MTLEFRMPDFSEGQLEFRVDKEGIAIYGTRDGLNAFARICMKLASRPANRHGTDHVHLEDQSILTQQSLNAAVAYFDIVDPA